MKLTLPQQDVYYDQLLFPQEPVYNIGAKIVIEGNIDYYILNRAYMSLINQHDAFRSIVVQNDDEAEMKVVDEFTSPLAFADFSCEASPHDAANHYMQQVFQQPFDLHSQEFLFRFILVKVSDTVHYLLSVCHHLITDGWGTSVMFQRFVKNYNELLEHGEIRTAYPFTYKDFAGDDSRYFGSKEFSEDKEYWKSRFETLPESLLEKIDKNIESNKGKRKVLVIRRALYNRLEKLAAEMGSTTFHVLLGVLYLYFGRKHRNTDVTMGLPVLNRGKAVFKRTVGLFMGISALRVKLSYDDSFKELVSNIQKQLRQDYRHQRFPVGKLAHELDVLGQRGQFFNISFSYEKQNFSDHFSGTVTTVLPMTNNAERFALSMHVREYDAARDVVIDFDYNSNYLDEDAVSRLVTHLDALLPQVCADPEASISSYDYLSAKEREQVLYRFNNTIVEHPDTTLLSLFEEQVQLKGESVAVFSDAGSCTYKQLDDISNRIARYLAIHFQVETSLPVAVLMPRSADLVAALLGVLKSGNAYIPLDPGFPEERLKYILEHSGAICVIGASEFSHVAANTPFIDVKKIIDDHHKHDLPIVMPADPAYILYTSGSTGNPKGVIIRHRAFLNFLLGMQRQPGLSAKHVFFSVTTQSFDISMLEFFGPLIAGGSVYIASRELLQDPLAVISKLKEIKPGIMQATPSFYQMLCNAGWEGNRHLKILCGGDLLSESLAAFLLNNCAELWNMYGPTETTIWSTLKRVRLPKDAANIGKPIANTQIYILDQCLQPLPVGVPGEIYIGGDGLAIGYHKDAGLTAEKFIPSPFNAAHKIYKTGDLGKWNKSGEIEFLGRSDHQVKIRGFRIELGEIESKLNALPAVASSVVITKKKQAQEAFLVAYVIPANEMFNVAEVIASLRRALPEYMVPGIVIAVESFPLTPNKKIDRKLLTSREIDATASAAGYVQAQTPLQMELCRLFKEVLGWEGEIGLHDNFFSFGGHSLNAMKLVNQVQKQLHYQLALKDIFDHPTVASLAEWLSGQKHVQSNVVEVVQAQSHYPVTPSQYAIWLAVQDKYKSMAYNLFVAYEITGSIDIVRLQNAFAAVIEIYESLRTNFIEVQGVPCQKLLSFDKVNFKIDVMPDVDVADYVNGEFNLRRDLLVKVGIFIKDDRQLLAFVSHHIVMDGWSVEVLIREVIHNYRDESASMATDFQFKDYTAWLLKDSAEKQATNEQFWKNYLDDYRWRPFASADSIGSANHLAGEYDFKWDKDFLSALKLAAQRHNATLHTFLITAFSVLLHKTQDENDLCIGTVNSGRTISGLHNQLGMFVKTLPLRTQVTPSQTFPQLIRSVRDDLLQLDAHQDMPADIYERLRLDVLFVLQPLSFNYEHIQLAPGVTLDLVPVPQKFHRLPLLVNFIENTNGLRCNITFDASKYAKEEVEILVLKYTKLLEQLMENTNAAIDEIDVELTLQNQPGIDIEFSF